ncbi:POTRA domain-containing protein [Lacinutrix sp. 5H-3-7-4]|uniref:POTRA domain-containing protein n=1 Tax=Lacinutrix sp. (strain 5H-3-7-4) TaxID=983544 RepID=UPI00020A3647|nr:POTRA domain-containing protein [Lacinutrix sp. 5H-3-7-4]AEH00268.1 surface antigen (D15) [Lacinutrix sp. 5H-3-7-4]
MHKYIPILIISLLIFSSELIAQNLNLEIIGSNDKETEVIKDLNYNKTHIDFNSILKEIDSLQNRVAKSGYIENNIFALTKLNDSTHLSKIHLGNKYKVIHIYFEKNQITSQSIKRITDNIFDSFFVIPFEEVENTLSFLNKEIANQGFPFNRLRLSDIKINNENIISARLIINNGEPKRGLDKIIVKGYEKFPKSYLKRFLKIKPSKTFNIDDIKNKVNSLNNLRFANQIKPPEVLFTKDSTQLYLYIEKANSNTFDGYLGFSTNENTNKLEFNGYLDLQLNNNFNYGESLKFLYKADELEQKTFNANINLPYILGSPIGTELELNIFKQDSSFNTVNQKIKFFYQINSKTRFFLGLDTVESNNLLESTNITQFNDYSSNFYTAIYNYEDRKNFNNRYQLKTLANIEIGTGSRNYLETNETQNRIIGETHHILNLNNKNSLFIRLEGALLISKNYLENELFRFGGINSIRGFQENSLLATKYGVLNTEYRYQLSRNIYTHTIIDFANLNNEVNSIKQNLYSFGLGFGILTKAGLLKFNYANGKSDNQKFKLNNSKIHLSLTSVF